MFSYQWCNKYFDRDQYLKFFLSHGIQVLTIICLAVKWSIQTYSDFSKVTLFSI